jgi:hypothetical protein
MDNQNFMYTLTPLVSTLTYMMREPNFSWMRVIPYLLPMLLPLLAYIRMPVVVTDMWYWIMGKLHQKHTISFTAQLKIRSWSNEPESVVRNFAILLWEWNRKEMTVNCKSLMEEAVASRFYDDDTDADRRCALFVDDRIHPFWHKDEPSIQYYMWLERNIDREGASHPEVVLRIDFMDTKYTTNSIVKHIEYIKHEAQRMTAARMLKQRVLVSTEEISMLSGESNTPSFMTYEFATTSSFKNFFSEESSIVESDIDYFLNHRRDYERTGKPWTYTILNEGPPGVGKTKLVKAIAAKTGYTLIIINLAHIRNIQTLYDAFHSPYLNGDAVPHDKRLYYIPEVDTQMMDVLQARVSAAANAATATTPVATEKTKSESSKDAYKFTVEQPKKPTLGQILNILDGVPERHGHILVMDTNHLANLDPALIRPGRVDRIVSWSKMSAASVRAYIQNYYMVELPKTVMLPDRAVTAAELQSYVCRHSDWPALVGMLLPQTVKQHMTTRSKKIEQSVMV